MYYQQQEKINVRVNEIKNSKIYNELISLEDGEYVYNLTTTEKSTYKFDLTTDNDDGTYSNLKLTEGRLFIEIDEDEPCECIEFENKKGNRYIVNESIEEVILQLQLNNFIIEKAKPKFYKTVYYTDDFSGSIIERVEEITFEQYMDI